MTRILIVHPRPTRGGFSAVISQAIELLQLGGFDVAVLVEEGKRVAEIPQDVERFILPYPLKSAIGVRRIRQIISSFRPDVLHLHGRQAGVVGRLVAPRATISTVLYTPHGSPWSGSSARGFLTTEISERLLLHRTDTVLCVSRSEQADWVRRDGGNKIVFLPNLIELDPPHRRDPDPAHDLRGRVVVPSGYNPQKRLEVVIEALAAMTGPRPDVLFCGSVDDPTYRQQIESLARARGVDRGVTFAGDIGDVVSAMRHADLVVLPSFTEGFPIVGQEAVLAEANVLWSAIPPHQELFGQTGGSFWTPAELASLLSEPADTFSVAGRLPWIVRSQQDARARRQQFWTDLRSGHG